MFIFTLNQGLGKVCPALIITAFVFLFFGMGTTQAAMPQDPPASVTIYLDAAINTNSSITHQNLISSVSGYEEAWIATELLSGETEVLVSVNGTPSLPPNTNIAIITIDDNGEIQEYLIRTDGGSVLIAIDDM